jgi:hypothetical protein
VIEAAHQATVQWSCMRAVLHSEANRRDGRGEGAMISKPRFYDSLSFHLNAHTIAFETERGTECRGCDRLTR